MGSSEVGGRGGAIPPGLSEQGIITILFVLLTRLLLNPLSFYAVSCNFLHCW